jgi:hypothetical protein
MYTVCDLQSELKEPRVMPFKQFTLVTSLEDSSGQLNVPMIAQTSRTEELVSLVPQAAKDIMAALGQRAIPSLAHDGVATAALASATARVHTSHRLVQGDARQVLPELSDTSVHLVLTSPPYWTLKKYPDNPNQLGAMKSFDSFLDELDSVWCEAYRRGRRVPVSPLGRTPFCSTVARCYPREMSTDWI